MTLGVIIGSSPEKGSGTDAWWIHKMRKVTQTPHTAFQGAHDAVMQLA